MAGQRREARPRGRPRLSGNVTNEDVKGQGDLALWAKYRGWPSLAPLTMIWSSCSSSSTTKLTSYRVESGCFSSSLEKFDSGADSLTNTDFYVTLDKLLRSLIEPLNVARNYASLGQLNRTIDANRMESGFAGSHGQQPVSRAVVPTRRT